MVLSLMEILTLLWLLVALFTWIATHFKSKKDVKINNTINLINNLSTVQHLQDADLRVRDAIRNSESLHYEDIDSELEKCLSIILDYYEFLSDLHNKNLIDKESIIHLRGGLMKETYKASINYINFWRHKLNRNDLYQQYGELCGNLISNNAFQPTQNNSAAEL